jgi:tartrate dehydratase alpha subunit/fumarate hydratase class I-like protein
MKSEGIEIVCELNTKVTAKQGKIIEKAIREAMKEAYPKTPVRALWVHQTVESVLTDHSR